MAQANANVFSDLDTFFTAWAGVAPSLERTIEGGPAALEQATYSLPYQAPFVEKSTEFMRLLRPTASALRISAQPLGHAFAEGAVNLRGRHRAELGAGREPRKRSRHSRRTPSSRSAWKT